jgi:thiamine-phosphate pyrophosphorylase
VDVPRLVLVTDRHATQGRDLEAVVAAALDAGLPAVQLRDKDLEGGTLFALAERLRVATRARGAAFFVNDRVDVAVAVGADGVHLGGESLPARVVRPLLPAGMLIGVSTHAPDQVAGAAADFAFFGPVYDTPSKRPFGVPQGVARLADAVRAAAIPVLAIGGVSVEHVAALRATGAHGGAVIRAVLAADDPGAATRALLAALAAGP